MLLSNAKSFTLSEIQSQLASDPDIEAHELTYLFISQAWKQLSLDIESIISISSENIENTSKIIDKLKVRIFACADYSL